MPRDEDGQWTTAKSTKLSVIKMLFAGLNPLNWSDQIWTLKHPRPLAPLVLYSILVHAAMLDQHEFSFILHPRLCNKSRFLRV
jgi:hypothetical protein